MLIQITNNCNMGCPHCLNKSGQIGDTVNMQRWTFLSSLEHAQRNNASIILISGGEPTMHPNWYDFVRIALSGCYDFKEVLLVTNGSWVGTDVEECVTDLLTNEPMFSVQITCIKGLYKMYDALVPKLNDYIERLKKLEKKPGMLHDRVHLCIDVPIHYVSLGRAAENEKFRKLASLDMSTTTSCFMGALLGAQLSPRLRYSDVIEILESRGHYCKPRINYRGEIGWSESALCPNFASVFDSNEEIFTRCSEWRPCGRCADYVKLLENPFPKYVEARNILGIRKSVHTIIDGCRSLNGVRYPSVEPAVKL